ncbi:hypothetical protein Gotri_015056 [Gossypium trilobum]|uniref:Uncharacterized protein n=1 Tax=Gossypium trilobum TaxID=34281 RepID=A0A7J9DZ02_9ROSI|nr:hypothetical protein [Gossypium trilobum]
MRLGRILANRNIWHVKVPLIVFAMVRIHEFDRGHSRKIDQHSTRSKSRFDNIGTITCQHVNHFTHRSWQHFQITWIGSGIMASRIYYRLQKGVGNVVVRGQLEGPSILGREKMLWEDQHLLHLYKRT